VLSAKNILLKIFSNKNSRNKDKKIWAVPWKIWRYLTTNEDFKNSQSLGMKGQRIRLRSNL